MVSLTGGTHTPPAHPDFLLPIPAGVPPPKPLTHPHSTPLASGGVIWGACFTLPSRGGSALDAHSGNLPGNTTWVGLASFPNSLLYD
jgi:hypothetical protein